jgi:hypothetical protein
MGTQPFLREIDELLASAGAAVGDGV